MSESEINFYKIPLNALNLSTRTQLAQYLNTEQVISCENGLSRDYRGVAELIGLSYNVIDRISRSVDPCKNLLDLYENRSDATVGQLLDFLEQIERFDILDDLTPVFTFDAQKYLNYKNGLSQNFY